MIQKENPDTYHVVKIDGSTRTVMHLASCIIKTNMNLNEEMPFQKHQLTLIVVSTYLVQAYF